MLHCGIDFAAIRGERLSANMIQPPRRPVLSKQMHLIEK